MLLDPTASHSKKKITLRLVSPVVLMLVAVCLTIFGLLLIAHKKGGVQSLVNQSVSNNKQVSISLTDAETHQRYELSLLIEHLSSHDNDVRRAALEEIKSLSHQSDENRTEVINELMRILDSPDFSSKLYNPDEATSYLWVSATEIQSDIKAAEAIDLLIEHINLISVGIGYASDNYRHIPAMRALWRMGEIPVPKLSDALQNSEPRVRSSAAICLGNLGGQAARDALANALNAETDNEVRREIKTSIVSIDRTPAWK